MSRIQTVSVAKAAKMMVRRRKPAKLREDRPIFITIPHRTSDSSAGEGDRDCLKYWYLTLLKF